MGMDEKGLQAGFSAAGLKRGDSVLVHSAMSSFGYVTGGAAAVVRALTETVGEDGLVIFPTLTGQASDAPSHPPLFDVRTTPCWTGRIPEYARQLPASVRSLHPTHSVASIGSRAAALAAGHEKGASPCDAASPYYKNAIWGGYILLIGVDEESNTTVHCCEELAGVPYHLQKEQTVMQITGRRGEKVTVTNRLHDWDKPDTDFNRIEAVLPKGCLTHVRIGNADVRVIQAGPMLDAVVNKLLKTPEYLVI